MKETRLIKGTVGRVPSSLFLAVTPLFCWSAYKLITRDPSFDFSYILKIIIHLWFFIWVLPRVVKNLYGDITNKFKLIQISGERFKIIDGNRSVFEGKVGDLHSYDTDGSAVYMYPNKNEFYKLRKKDIPETFPLTFA